MHLHDLKANASGAPIFYRNDAENSDIFYQAHLTLLPDGKWVAWAEHGRRNAKHPTRVIIKEKVNGVQCDTWTDPAKAVAALNQRVKAKLKKNYRSADPHLGDGTLQ